MSLNIPIAVIGVACRFPGGADSPEKLWKLLADGRDGWTEVPKARWDWRTFYHPDPAGTESSNSLNFSHAYFLGQDISAFDAQFFGISPREAKDTDPQQRILMEAAYEAFENAGAPLETIRGSNTSVHVAVFVEDYDRMGYRDLAQLPNKHMIGSGTAILANRLSYVFDLKGPSNVLDTGCSGGLVALHQACLTLQANEATMAVAGATQLLLSPDQSIAMSQFGLINKDGKCYTFDSRGHGYARGEGVGVLILKRLDRAVVDGDPVQAVIVGSGINHDGQTDGIFLPNPKAQISLAQSVYATARLDPHETLYVESHGTGTVAGDLAEATSISAVFGRDSGRAHDVLVGSVKTNIGHLEAASGIAGFIKAMMVVKKKWVPPNLNFISPKPSLDLEKKGIKIPLQLAPLTPKGHVGPRRASVNSFGYGGTNAHVIIEAYEHDYTKQSKHPAEQNEPRLMVLSARSEKSLRQAIFNLQQWLVSDEGGDVSMDHLAYTLAVRRSALPWRYSTVTSNVQGLEQVLTKAPPRMVKAAEEVRLAFIFTGQGAQWFAMGRELLATPGVFRESVELSAGILESLGCDWAALDELSRDSKASRLGESRISQPLTTVIQMALVDLLESFSIVPDAVCGHSSGEIAAAYAAGILDREAAVKVAYHRGIFSSMAAELNPVRGAMLAVGEAEEAVVQRLAKITQGKATVACVNSPQNTTVSGDLDAIKELEELLNTDSIFNRLLRVDTAYHSHHMKAVAQPYFSAIENIRHNPPRPGTAFYSSTTGSPKTSDFGAQYWVRNMVSQVKFSVAIRKAMEHLDLISKHTGAATTKVVVEVGPHSTLEGPLRQSLSSFDYTYIPSLVRSQSAFQTTLALVGRMFETGYQIDLKPAVNLNSRGPQSVVTTLPTYPWDHSATYWHESRQSHLTRLRPFPYHDLLGLLDVANGPQVLRWRHHVSIKALPWLQDHVVDGLVIFPGAGYITMAIEAMKQVFQLRNKSGKIKNISLRHVSFTKPLVIGQDGQTEMQLMLIPTQDREGSMWERYRIHSYNSEDNSWMEHSTGEISVETTALVDEIDGTREHDMAVLAALSCLRTTQESTTVEVTPDELYSQLADSGNSFGPAFRGIEKVKLGKMRGLTTVVVRDIAPMMPGKFMQPHLIHPTVLDAVIHLQVQLFRQECSIAPIMPESISEMSISLETVATAGAELLVAMDLLPEGPQMSLGNVWAFQKRDNGTLAPVITCAGIRIKAIGETVSDNIGTSLINYNLEWRLDVDYITKESFLQHVSRLKLFDLDYNTRSKLKSPAKVKLVEQVATIYIRDALAELQQAQKSAVYAPHLSKLWRWMADWYQSNVQRVLGQLEAKDENAIIERAKADNIMGLALHRVGPNLADIIKGKTSGLELLMQDNILSRIYSECQMPSCYAQMVEYLKALVCKNSNMNVLEVGAGTGGTTLPLMEGLGPNGRLLLNRYTYTDISTGFFEKAGEKLGRWTDQIEFKALDISRDPVEQGFVAKSYDLVVASAVLHATESVKTAVANVHKLLKPGGRLILIEMTRLTAQCNVIYGILEGWWLNQEGQDGSSILSAMGWRFEALLFSNAEIVVPDHLGPTAICTLMVAKALDEQQNGLGHDPEGTSANMKTKIQLGYPSPAGKALGGQLQAALEERDVSCSLQPLNANETDLETVYIIIDSAEHALMLNPAPEMFHHIRHLLTQNNRILWVSFHESAEDDRKVPTSAIITGISRVVRREHIGAQLVTVDIQQDLASHLQSAVETLADICVSSFWPASGVAPPFEDEYVLRGGELQIPRLAVDFTFSSHVEAASGSGDPVQHRYLDKDRPLVLEAQTPGLLHTLRFVDGSATNNPITPDDIQLEAHAYGINFKDVYIAMGQMPHGVNMVGEVAGIVTAVGLNHRTRFDIGDRVVGIHAAPFGSQVRINGWVAATIPEKMSFAEAASIPAVFYTARYCLTEAARLEKNQTILVHAASGGVGQATIQLAKSIGAEVFATVSSVDKSRLIQEQYGIPESHIFSSQSGSFKKGILRLTKNKGVDVIVNSLSGDRLMDTWECIAEFGTFVEIGKADIYKRTQLPMTPFDKHVTFLSVDISLIARKFPQMAGDGLRKVFSMFEEGVLRPVYPITTYPMGDIEEAFRKVTTRKHVGKQVLVADEKTMVKAVRAKPQPLHLRPDGTYIIGGGLGYMGKRISCFLASKGAGHIVLLTRRCINAQQRAPLEDEIRQLGASLHVVTCDITDQASIRAASTALAALPPVKGIIQAAIVLRDQIFENMTLEDYKAALGPKVLGTINMQNSFCTKDTDFFITLSSVSNIVGLASQSNYNAGNSFQDAFAHTNNSQSGTKYVSINVGVIKGSDHVEQVFGRQQGSTLAHIRYLSVGDFFATLEYAMDHRIRPDTGAQCVMNFGDKVLNDKSTTGVPLFELLRGSSQKHASTRRQNHHDTVIEAITQATSLQEASGLIEKLLIDKFATFLAVEVVADRPVSSMGLDSLVAIELKNWVVYSFKVPLQSSELSGARSIMALAKTIASRMDIACKKGEPQDEQSPPEVPRPGHGEDCCRFSEKLILEPRPDLNDALEFYLGSMAHTYSPQRLDVVQRELQAISAPDSAGRRAFQEIAENEHGIDSYWLFKRSPIAPFSNYLTIFKESSIPHSQAERAALIATSAFAFKLANEAGQVPPMWSSEKPVCMWPRRWLFNTVREPRVRCDSIVRYDGHQHVVVLRRGRAFKVELCESGSNPSLQRLRAIFEAILERVTDEGVWTGMLTTDDRDSWALIRQKLITASPAAAEYFRAIETAMFIINLDDGAPETPEERMRHAYIRDGFNRWFDKSVQFTVSANGRSSIICEHSVLDGASSYPLTEWVHGAIQAHQPGPEPLRERYKEFDLEELSIDIGAEIEGRIEMLRKRYCQHAGKIAYKDTHLAEFGVEFLTQARVPIKSVIDIMFQLAVYIFFGHNVPSWEATNWGHFHKGRTSHAQNAVPELVEFCKAVAEVCLDESIELSPATATKLFGLLEAARNGMRLQMREVQAGRSHVRLMALLDMLWPEDTAKPSVLSDGVWGQPCVFPQTMGVAEISVDGLLPAGQTEEDIAAMMHPETDSVRVFLSTFDEERATLFIKALHCAARIMRKIIEASVN